MPSVEFERSVSVKASPHVVWATVTDVDRIAKWVPVVGAVREIKHLSKYAAVLADRLGPFRLAADLDVTVTDVDEHRSVAFSADGEDRQVASRIRIDARLALTPDGEATQVDVAGHYEVTGRVAALGGSMIRAKGDKILDQFFSALEAEWD